MRRSIFHLTMVTAFLSLATLTAFEAAEARGRGGGGGGRGGGGRRR